MDFATSHRRCDWRVYQDPTCPEYPFFRTVFIVFLAVFSLVVVLLFYSLCFRFFALKDKLGSFLHGLNASLLYLFLSQIFYAIHLALVIGGANPIAAEVIWLLGISAVISPMLNHLNLIIEAIPGLRYTAFQVPAFVINPKIRAAILLSFGGFIVASNCILVPLSDYYLEIGNLPLSKALFSAGMGVVTGQMCIMFVVFSFFFYHFRKASANRMNSIKDTDIRANKKEFKLLVLTVEKVNRAFYSMLLLLPFSSLFTLLMASYQDFFNNYPLSKAFMILFFLLFGVSGLVLSLTFIRVDWAKYKNREEISNSSDHFPNPKQSEDPVDTALEEFQNRKSTGSQAA